MQERNFTREPIGRFEWERLLRQVRVSSPSVKLVGFAMATYADVDGSKVRPGQARLAAVLGTSISTVRRGQSELESIGMLELMVKGRSIGRGHQGAFSSEYRLSVPSDLDRAVPMIQAEDPIYEAPATGSSEKNHSPTTPSSQEQPVISENYRSPVQELPVTGEELPVTGEHPPQHKHQTNDQNITHQFEAWYAAYPKHTSRGAAVRAYGKARKNGVDATTLLEGARRYASERKGQDPRYTKMPATWLNQECWKDEPHTDTKLTPWDRFLKAQSSTLTPWDREFHEVSSTEPQAAAQDLTPSQAETEQAGPVEQPRAPGPRRLRALPAERGAK